MKKRYLLFFSALLLLLVFSACDDECKHESMTKNVTPATCNSAGYVTYDCDNCDYSYTSEFTDPLKHSLHKTIVAPTCSSDGYTTYTCDCGYSYRSDIVEHSGHDYKSTVITPDCTEGGYTLYTCKNCNESYIDNPTDATGHTLTSLVVPSECEKQGYTEVSCFCGYSFRTDFTEPKGHDFKENTVLPTCTEEGYTEYICDCGYSFISDYTKPTGHKYTESTVTEATCTEKGEVKYICNCGEFYSLITPPLEHSFTREVTAPTLSDVGYSDFYCERCDFSYRAEYKFYSSILSSAYADSSEVLHKGIDISYHNYSVDSNGEYISLDFDAIKAAGIDYVIIRLGDAAIGIDPTFEKSYAEAKAAGLDVGAYFYTRATTKDEILREANLILSALDGKQFEYPIYLDLEDDSLSSVSSIDLNEMCFAFFTRLQRAGYYTGLYVNHEWLYNHVDTTTALSKFDIWYARYPVCEEGKIPAWNEESYGKPFGMWQYSDSGYIDGIEGVKFDFNYCYKNYPTIIKEGGFNGYDANIKFPDSDKAFAWVIYDGSIKIRSKSDYFVLDDYDSNLDVIGYAKYSDRFEVVEVTEQYTAILYNGEIAYISANPLYVSYEGLYKS